MNDGIYIDTSLLVAYYAPEVLSAKAQQELVSASAVGLSWLVRTEVASALAKKRRRGELATAEVSRLLDRFEEHVSAGLFRLLPVDGEDYEHAYRWIQRESLSLRTLDALHLAVAVRTGLVLVTADRGLAAAARTLELRHELVTA